MVDSSLSWPDQMFVSVYLIDQVMASEKSGTTAIQVPKGGVAALRVALGLPASVEIPAFPNGDIATVSLPSVPVIPQQEGKVMGFKRRSGRHRK